KKKEGVEIRKELEEKEGKRRRKKRIFEPTGKRACEGKRGKKRKGGKKGRKKWKRNGKRERKGASNLLVALIQSSRFIYPLRKWVEEKDQKKGIREEKEERKERNLSQRTSISRGILKVVEGMWRGRSPYFSLVFSFFPFSFSFSFSFFPSWLSLG